MKSFRKLLKGFIVSLIGILAAALLFFGLMVICMFAVSAEYLLQTILFFLLFTVLGFIALLVYGIVVVCLYDKAKEKLRSIPGFSEERFEREVARGPKIKNMLLCSDAICYYGGSGVFRTIPIRDIVWVYQDQIKYVMNIHIVTRDKEESIMAVAAKGKSVDAACRYILRLIARKNKGALIGYEESYQTLFKNDFPRLVMRAQGEIVDSRLLEQEYIQNNYYEKDFQ